MLVFSVAVLTLVVTAVVGQDENNCQCISYFLCNGTIIENESQCADDFDVCCIMATSPNINIDPVIDSSTTEESIRPPRPPPPPVKDLDVSMCGKRGENALDPAIDWKVFGDDVSTSFGEFPWMVAIMKSDPTGRIDFLCGGSIIYPNIILTAAHSVRGYSERDLVVKAGVWDTVDPEEARKHQDRAVSRIVIHPGFDRVKIIANDIAILVLSQPFTITDNVATVCLPSPEVQLNTSGCVATGWGTDNFGKNTTSTVLKKVDLPLVDYETCQNELRKIKKLGGAKFNLHNSFICAGGEKTDTCKGDGGGPLMCPSLDDPKHYTQVGVTAWGVECGKGPPGVYASVQAAATWIEDTVLGSL